MNSINNLLVYIYIYYNSNYFVYNNIIVIKLYYSFKIIIKINNEVRMLLPKTAS